MHKATRAAEKMLGALLRRVATLARQDNADAETGLPKNHPVLEYFSKDGATLQNYLALDDMVLWGSLPMLASSPDNDISELAKRLRYRSLYKCLDVGILAESVGGDALPMFRNRLQEAFDDNRVSKVEALVDGQTISPYKYYDYEDSGALEKIMIEHSDSSRRPIDLAEDSPMVKALGEERIYRVYGRDKETMRKLEQIWEGIKGK